MYNNSVKKENRQELNGTAFLEWNAFKGFTARLDYSLRYYNQYYKEAATPVQSYDFQADRYKELWYIQKSAGVTDRNSNGYKTLMNFRLNYGHVFGGVHDMRLMAIYSEEFWYNRSNTTARADRIHPSLSEIDAALTTQQTTSGTSSREGRPLLPGPWALKPASQYRQSNVHTLPSRGDRFTPSDVPSLREWIGPNTVSENITVCIV